MASEGKTLKDLLVDNEVYGTTALNKKIKLVKEYLANDNKEYTIDSTETNEVIEMLQLVMQTSKGKPKEKMLILLSEFGYEINPKTVEQKPNRLDKGLTEDLETKIAKLDNKNNPTGYDILELLREIHTYAEEKIKKKVKQPKLGI